ncbi:conserved hypothetical protein [Leishmania major strain Friedlin]|uniref:Uncharacterized protein n=1 Tax=Leishmania major TaxID=5664 RepID=E9ACQ3_LEIMA|nr:conserved hypothetical protein [Leishmania major strain Friedlin]CAG9569050.1 hypothetical_protein_-_conserved [Leishmania major strain Friedlin]CBZ05784.1 conserved hypothetical protein [Leishmania major strain Friedlin]|eukprot:XP_003721778.1 conserved hypothetical protein [Leishmania major strain Friedlin]
MRCATRISRSLFKGADRGTGSPWCGTSIVRAVGAIHGLQVGTLDITGVSAGLQCTLSTSSFFSVDDDGGGGPAAPLLPSERAELHTPGVVAQPEMSTEGSVYIVHVVGPAAFVAVVAEVLSDDVLVDLAGRYHVEPYAYWRSGKHKCPTVRLSYDRLRRTEDSLRILRAPDNTVARQRRLYHAVFLASQP